MSDSPLTPQKLAILLHEIRNPLTTLTTLAKLLQKRLDPDDANYWIGSSIEQECQQMRALLKQLDPDQSFDKNTESLPQNPLDVGSYLQTLLPTYQALAETYGATFQYISELEGAVILHRDPLPLRQVLTNLIDNACKYLATTVTLRVLCNEQEIKLAIEDDGSGIPAADLPHIFQPYYRAQVTGIPGQGLGLAISRELVEKMGGSLTVESLVGQGSTFTIGLPLEDPRG